MQESERALPYFTRAVELKPEDGIIRFRLGALMESLGRLEEAKALYHRASELGFKGADLELRRLEAPAGGSVPSKKAAPAAH